MHRINVVGTTGSGKSHFARALAQHLDVDYIQMDQLHWKANWVESTTEELLSKLASKTSAATWVLDGNYSKTNDMKWRNADTIIWLDYSFSRTFYQLLNRTIARAWTRAELWPGTGNAETWRNSFMSSDSILIWLLKTYSKNKRRYSAIQLSSSYQHINFIRLQSPAEAAKFLESVASLQESNSELNNKGAKSE